MNVIAVRVGQCPVFLVLWVRIHTFRTFIGEVYLYSYFQKLNFWKCKNGPVFLVWHVWKWQVWEWQVYFIDGKKGEEWVKNSQKSDDVIPMWMAS